jgi:ABC-type multidrug transport system fused ATPase/permease subunit
MRTLLTKLLKVVPGDWRRVVGLCTRLQLVTRVQVFNLALLSFLSVTTEVFGLFTILPILQFISHDRDVTKLAGESRIWSVIADISASTHIPITLAGLCIVVFVLICIRQITQYAFTVYLARVQEQAVKSLRERMFSAILNSRGAHVDSLGSGAYVNTIVTSCHYGGTAVGSVAKLGVVLLSFAAYGAGLLLIAPAITAIVIVSGLALGSVMRYFRMSAERLSRKIIDHNERFIQYLSERHRAWRLIKLSDTGAVEVDKFMQQARAIGGLTVAIARNSAIVQMLTNPVGALLMLGGLYMSVEYFNLTVAELTLFVLIYLRVMPLTNTILAGRQQLATVFVNLAQAKSRLREAQGAREIDTGTRVFDGVRQKIFFRDIVFRYSETSAALQGLNIEFPAHAFTALTGPSGSGKSTLVDLLPRVLVPSSGQVLIDGIDLKEFTLASLRRGIAFVPQTPILFHATIAENVQYGCPEATQSDLKKACDMAFVDEFVHELPERYDTIVGESGYTLSGGQRQRIALARAFLRGCSLLVLDEATSALDYHSEQRIKEAIQQYRERYNATVIVVAHRLSTIRSADHLIVLEKGRVVEQGPPKSLSFEGNWFHETMKLETQ